MAASSRHFRLTERALAGRYEVVQRRADGSLVLRPEHERLSELLRETYGKVFQDKEFIVHLERVAATQDDLPWEAGTPPSPSVEPSGNAKATGVGGNIGAVPTISRFFGITIAMYFDDHGHPHFHARRAGAQAKVRIDEIEVMESALPVRDLRLVLAWAELHQEELLENWQRARVGETLLDIEPLR